MASGKGNVAMQNKRYKLRCKIKRGEAQGKDVSHFKNQLAELSRQSIHYEKIYSSKKERNLFFVWVQFLVFFVFFFNLIEKKRCSDLTKKSSRG